MGYSGGWKSFTAAAFRLVLSLKRSSMCAAHKRSPIKEYGNPLSKNIFLTLERMTRAKRLGLTSQVAHQPRNSSQSQYPRVIRSVAILSVMEAFPNIGNSVSSELIDIS